MAKDLAVTRPESQVLFPAEPSGLRHVAAAMAQGNRQLQGEIPGHAGGGERTGCRLPASSHGGEDSHAIHLPGGHHEWCRPGPPGHHPRREPLHEASGQGLLLQPAGREFTHLDIRQTAQSAHVPVVGVYETMPTPGYDYQSVDDGRGRGDPSRRRARNVEDATVTVTPILEVDNIGLSFSWQKDPRRSLVRDSRRGIHWADRLQWRRQDDAATNHPGPAAT